MTSTTHTVAGSSYVERFIALSTTFAPVAVGAVAPLMDSGAAFAVTVAYGCVAGVTASNYMGRLSERVLSNLPAGDIFRAHRSPMFVSTLTTGMALAVGAVGGAEYTDALMAGFLGLPSLEGVVSLAWWGAVGLVPFKLRRVLRPTGASAPVGMSGVPESAIDRIYATWRESIGDHALSQVRVGDGFWSGVVSGRGKPSRVTVDTVSAVYRVPADWVSLTKGAHAGEQLLRVNLVAPEQRPEPSGLEELWALRVAGKGGILPGSYLTEVTVTDSGTVAYVNAAESANCLPATVSRRDLVGALRKSALLVSYEPVDERTAVVRVMDRSPLREGTPLTSREHLRMSEGGVVKIGVGISGHPARLPLFDPAMGGQHLFIAGGTGAGKSGAVQLVALAAHVNGAAVVYADPKGSSNPAVAKMAAHAGLGVDGAMDALRVAHLVFKHRVAESAELGLKNFTASPERPWVPVILDEASALLGPGSPHRKEAVSIVKDLTSRGRSLGMPFILVNQAVNLDGMGGEADIRINLINGGSWLILRTDSSQTNLADMPPGFDDVDPSQIPGAWSEKRSLVYDESAPENDPIRTFGLGYLATAGGSPEMFRTLMCEDASEFIDYDSIAVPRDFPDWDRRMELIAKADGAESEGEAELIPVSMAKAPTAEESILAFLEAEDASDPLGTVYVTKDDLRAALPGISEQTLNNTLTRMGKAGKVHGPRGSYGLGPGA